MRTLLLAAAAAAALSGPAFARPATGDERAAIEDLAYRYIFALDWRDSDAYANTFTQDGRLSSAAGIAEGRPAIRQVVQSIRDRELAALPEGSDGQGTGHNQHFVTSMVIEVAEDGNSARAWAYWTAVAGVEPRAAAYGHYADTLEKVDGQWLYSSRRTYNEQSEGRETHPFLNPVTNPDQYGTGINEGGRAAAQ